MCACVPYLQGKAESLGLSKQRSRDILKHRDECERRWPVIKRLDLLWHMTSFSACLPQSIVILEIHQECTSCTFPKAESSIHFQSTIFVGVSGSGSPHPQNSNRQIHWHGRQNQPKPTYKSSHCTSINIG